MKVALFFLGGMVAAFLIVFGFMYFGSESRAQDTATENTSETLDLTSLLPDVKGIYRTCLSEPFKQVETEIHDPDIARYYHGLMEKTGLTDDYTQ